MSNIDNYQARALEKLTALNTKLDNFYKLKDVDNAKKFIVKLKEDVKGIHNLLGIRHVYNEIDKVEKIIYDLTKPINPVVSMDDDSLMDRLEQELNNKINEYKVRINQLHVDYGVLEEEKKRLEEEKKILEIKLEDAKDTHLNDEKKIVLLNDSLDALRNQLRELEEKNTKCQEELKEVKDQRVLDEIKINHLNDEKKNLDNKVNDLKNQIHNLTVEINGLKLQLIEAQYYIVHLTARYDEDQKHINDLKNQHDADQKRINDLKNQHDEDQKRINDLKNQHDEDQKRINDLKNQHDEDQKRIAILETEVASLKENLNVAQLSIHNYENKVLDLDREIKQKDIVISNLQALNADYLQQISLLNTEIVTLTNTNNTLRRQLQDSENERRNIQDLLNEQKSQFDREVQTLNQQLQVLMNEKNQLVEDNTDLTRRITDLEREFKEKTQEYEGKKTVLERRLEECIRENSALKAQVTVLQTDNTELIRNIQQITLKITEHENTINDLKNQLKDQETKFAQQITALQNKETELRQELKTCTDEKNELLRQLAEKNASEAGLRRQLLDYENKNRTLEDELKKCRENEEKLKEAHVNEVKTLNSQINEQQRRIAALEQENRTLNDNLNDQKQLYNAMVTRKDAEIQSLVDQLNTVNRQLKDCEAKLKQKEEECKQSIEELNHRLRNCQINLTEAQKDYLDKLKDKERRIKELERERDDISKLIVDPKDADQLFDLFRYYPGRIPLINIPRMGQFTQDMIDTVVNKKLENFLAKFTMGQVDAIPLNLLHLLYPKYKNNLTQSLFYDNLRLSEQEENDQNERYKYNSKQISKMTKLLSKVFNSYKAEHDAEITQLNEIRESYRNLIRAQNNRYEENTDHTRIIANDIEYKFNGIELKNITTNDMVLFSDNELKRWSSAEYKILTENNNGPAILKNLTKNDILHLGDEFLIQYLKGDMNSINIDALEAMSEEEFRRIQAIMTQITNEMNQEVKEEITKRKRKNSALKAFGQVSDKTGGKVLGGQVVNSAVMSILGGLGVIGREKSTIKILIGIIAALFIVLIFNMYVFNNDPDTPDFTYTPNAIYTVNAPYVICPQ